MSRVSLPRRQDIASCFMLLRAAIPLHTQRESGWAAMTVCSRGKSRGSLSYVDDRKLCFQALGLSKIISFDSIEAPMDSIEAPMEFIGAPMKSIEAPIYGVHRNSCGFHKGSYMDSIEAPMESI